MCHVNKRHVFTSYILSITTVLLVTATLNDYVVGAARARPIRQVYGIILLVLVKDLLKVVILLVNSNSFRVLSRFPQCIRRLVATHSKIGPL